MAHTDASLQTSYLDPEEQEHRAHRRAELARPALHWPLASARSAASGRSARERADVLPGLNEPGRCLSVMIFFSTAGLSRLLHSRHAMRFQPCTHSVTS
jgi:hypothetical protein